MQRRGASAQPTADEHLKCAEAILRAAPPDWDDVYLRLRASCFGADYPSHVFLRTPIGVVRRLLSFISDEDQRKANEASMTQAQVCNLILNVAHGLSGAKGGAPKTRPKDFLPYPQWKPKSSKGSEGPSDGTRFILSTLANKRRIPLHILSALMTSPEDAG